MIGPRPSEVVHRGFSSPGPRLEVHLPKAKEVTGKTIEVKPSDLGVEATDLPAGPPPFSGGPP